MKRQGILLVCVWLVSFSLQANGVYNVRDYGAKGDGKTLDHIAINKAIEAATANGGGQVVLSSGTYLCGSIRLKSNVDLHLMPGAKILAAPALMKAYDESESFGGFPEYQDGGHTYFHNSLIWADEQQNISITGRGMIDGEGLTTRDTETAGNPQGGSIGTGDKAIALKLCRNVTIRDITIYCGGHFAIIATGCDIGTIDNVTIDTNRDGIDIDCCKYFTVSNTKVNTPNDDAIVLKSSYALKRPVLCEHILITNCIVTGYKLGSLLNGKYIPEKVNWVCGRIKLGTESNGGYRNITISNCTCMWSSGLAFEEVDQGRMENIMVSNISLSHVHHYPIYITTGCRNRGPKEVTRLSSARDIYINNVVADDCDSLAGIIITGMEGEPIRNVSLSNIRIQYRGGAKKVTTPYREQGTNYPEPRWAGPTPAYGLFARHVDGLHLQNVKFELMRPDERPDIILENVRNYSAMPKVQLQDEVLQTAQKANDYFMAKNSDPTQPTNVNKLRPSSLWTRAVYYEGLMALNTIDPQQRYIDYAMRWADFHQWTPRNGVNTCDADDQCCGQTYVELLPYTGKDYKELLVNVIANLDHQMLTPNTIIQGSASHAHTHINSLYGWWTWIDAIQMAMPLYMQVSKLTGNTKYRDHALKMYLWTRNKCGGGCFNTNDGLWWRDADYVPPYKEPDGNNCYWSRGNGWVYAALLRSMNLLSPEDKAYKLFKKDFLLMSEALLKCQHEDGFWHASLVSDAVYPNPEMTGTALFLYGMSWGIKNGLLKADRYRPACDKAWQALKSCLHNDGFLGWNQGTGKDPSAGQPVTFTSVPDFEDYGTGCYLLGLTEYYKLYTTNCNNKR